MGTKGQKFVHCLGTKRQGDKLKILPRAGTGRDSLSKPGIGCDTGQYKILTACPVPSCRTKRDRTEKYVLKPRKDILKQKKDVLRFRRILKPN